MTSTQNLNGRHLAISPEVPRGIGAGHRTNAGAAGGEHRAHPPRQAGERGHFAADILIGNAIVEWPVHSLWTEEDACTSCAAARTSDTRPSPSTSPQTPEKKNRMYLQQKYFASAASTILVNNAGPTSAARATDRPGSRPAFAKTFESNLSTTGVTLHWTCQVVRSSNGGAIVHTASTAACTSRRTWACQSHESPAALMPRRPRQLARNFFRRGPGKFHLARAGSDQSREALSEDHEGRLADERPLGRHRFETPLTLAAAVAFLVSRTSRSVDHRRPPWYDGGSKGCSATPSQDSDVNRRPSSAVDFAGICARVVQTCGWTIHPRAMQDGISWLPGRCRTGLACTS